MAALAGIWIAVTRILGEGPKITITFDSAEGLEAGKTKIHYKGVDVGTLTTIGLSDDHQRVIATAQMAPKTEDFLVEDTQFWVVRPRISGANVTGLGTLISGAFIGMEIGHSKESKRDFVALETPPVITGDSPGRFFVLKTPDLGSLDIGTPIFFRRLQVGQVASYTLDNDGQFFTLKIFVQAPYDQYVTPNTRFWQASGIDLSALRQRADVQTQSLLSILIGGIAFETPPSVLAMPVRPGRHGLPLYANRARAFEPPARNPQTYELIFNQSVRGLKRGAPVDFRGIQIGEVTDIQAQIDRKTSTSRSGDNPVGPPETWRQVVRRERGRWSGYGAAAKEINRQPDCPRRPGATADREPADRSRVRGVRLLPWLTTGNRRLVATSSTVAHHSGRTGGT